MAMLAAFGRLLSVPNSANEGHLDQVEEREQA